MTLSEILPSVQELPRSDKLRLIQMLASELIRDEDVVPPWNNQTVPVWSPYDAYEGACTLLSVLKEG
jgi:hypothetical protein